MIYFYVFWVYFSCKKRKKTPWRRTRDVKHRVVQSYVFHKPSFSPVISVTSIKTSKLNWLRLQASKLEIYSRHAIVIWTQNTIRSQNCTIIRLQACNRFHVTIHFAITSVSCSEIASSCFELHCIECLTVACKVYSDTVYRPKLPRFCSKAAVRQCFKSDPGNIASLAAANWRVSLILWRRQLHRLPCIGAAQSYSTVCLETGDVADCLNMTLIRQRVLSTAVRFWRQVREVLEP